MPRNFKELGGKLPQAAQDRVERRVNATLERMALHELRRERKRTQHAMAEHMNVTQSEISKIEQRSELRLGTLQEYVHALGGRLEMRAVFPEKSVELVIAGE